VGKDKVQKIMVSLAPPLINFGSSVVVIKSSFRELVVAIVAYIGKNF
jgi:hypothetical protein